MSWEKEAGEIKKRHTLAGAQGGQEAIDKQHSRGKLTIRERIVALTDADSFQEHGKLAGGAYLDDNGEVESFTPANYVVGFGEVGGQRVAIGGEDFTVKGGSPNAAGLRRSIYAEHLAVQYRVPLVRLLEGGGGSVDISGSDPRVPRTVGDAVYEEPRFAIIAEAMGVVPVASAALGAVAGFPAGRLVASHFSVMTRDTAQVMIGGPALVERALGLKLSKEELGGADVHATSGVVDNIAEDEPDAFRQINRFLHYLPQNAWQRSPRGVCEDPVGRREQALLSIVPRDQRQPYNITDVIDMIVDRDSFFQICSQYGPSLVVGLARMNGQSVGVTGNDCRYVAGAMTAEAAQKMRRFVEMCDTFHLPMVNFIDEPGFMIGPRAEQGGAIRYGMAAVMASSRASVPWASILIRKNFGVASAAHYGPGAYKLSWPSAQYGALPIEGGIAVAYRRQIAEAKNPNEMRAKLETDLARTRSPYPMAESFAVHELIDPRETRPALCDWIEWIQPQLEVLTSPVTFSMRS